MVCYLSASKRLLFFINITICGSISIWILTYNPPYCGNYLTSQLQISIYIKKFNKKTETSLKKTEQEPLQVYRSTSHKCNYFYDSWLPSLTDNILFLGVVCWKFEIDVVEVWLIVGTCQLALYTADSCVEVVDLLFELWAVKVGVGHPHHYNTTTQLITK